MGIAGALRSARWTHESARTQSTSAYGDFHHRGHQRIEIIIAPLLALAGPPPSNFMMAIAPEIAVALSFAMESAPYTLPPMSAMTVSIEYVKGVVRQRSLYAAPGGGAL